ncbi:YeaH/YhbH family protein [Persicobacter psychrovividus]|uniref:UPF0229 protein PEPS_01540 n=1 Tax=Persicobacter psychrovividus TaxID=387638 RepID=A0ABM7VAE1_9BACT|nr:UPF0229 protein [Persicobacter psychrovividus]
MGKIIDRRQNSKGKSTSNRHRFLRRVEDQIKKALPDLISQEKITDASKGGTVRVPIKKISEPSFHHDGRTGNKTTVRPGNDRFNQGDKIPKPPSGEGKGSGQGQGSNDPAVTEDEFSVTITRDEFLHYFFDDLELPNLLKKYMEQTEATKLRRAGYSKEGSPAKLAIKTSYQQSMARQIAIKGVLKKKLEGLKAAYESSTDVEEKASLLAEIELVEKQMKNVPFFDHIDLRYKNHEPHPQPITSAVMFCIMDVSASMGEHEKDIAKRFFTLLYIFLQKQYKKIEIVFIRHHTVAKEVDEEEFFNSRESGGTIVAPSLKLMRDIIRERYNLSDWNIYCCQASDGDAWSERDAVECRNIIKEQLLPQVQYMAYLEINNSEYSSYLWQNYKAISEDSGFSIRKIYQVSEIWPVFKGLFKKKSVIKTT